MNVTWANGLDPKSGRPIEKPEARYSAAGKPALVAPGPLGGHNWQPMSYSPATGLVYVPALDGGFMYVPADPQSFQRRAGVFWNNGLHAISSSLPDDEAIRKAIRASAKGRIIAWDPVQRKSVWTAEFPVPWNGGLLSTAGGLVFHGNGMGRFVAYDAANGKTLWDFHAQTGIVAAPVTYEVGGEQYVTILAGWGGAAPLFAGEIVTQAAKGGLNRILTFKLGGAATLPPLLTVKRPLNPPALTASKEALEQGGALYRSYCTRCHGHATVAGGVVTDLRYSAMLGSPEAHRAVVLDGVLMRNGMISFSDFLKPDDVEAIRAYVIEQAHREQKRLSQ